MKQNIETIGIKYLHPFYVTKNVIEKNGILKNKTKSIEVNIDLDYDKMKSEGYPEYVIKNMMLEFEQAKKINSNPHIRGTRSVEFTLKKIQSRLFCKIISVVHDGDYRLCVVWEGE